MGGVRVGAAAVALEKMLEKGKVEGNNAKSIDAALRETLTAYDEFVNTFATYLGEAK